MTDQQSTEGAGAQAAPAAGLAHLRDTAGIFEDEGRALVVLRGADRAKYANAMLTNQVQALAPGQGCLACALTVKGKVIAFLRALKVDDAVLLDVDAPRAEALRDHLRRFIVINKVTVEVGPAIREIGVEGPQAAEVVRAALDVDVTGLAPLASIEAAPALRVARLAITGAFGFRALVAPDAYDALHARLLEAAAALGGGAASPAAVLRARIEHGFPAWGAEIDEDILPPQAGLADVAISYTKGCYLGQEPIAMLKFRGKINKRVVRLAIEGPAPAPGTPLVAAEGGAEAGWVTSAAPAGDGGSAGARSIALAFVKRPLFDAGVRLKVGSAGGAEAVVQELEPVSFGGG